MKRKTREKEEPCLLLSSEPVINGEKNNTRLEERIKELTKRNEELENNVQKLDRKVFDLSTISQASKVFTTTLDPDRLCEILTSIIAERLKIKAVAILLHDDKTQAYYVARSIGIPDDDANSIRFMPREGLFWQLITSGKPFSVIDVAGNPRFSSAFEEFNLEKLHSNLWLPLLARDQVIGILTIKDDGLDSEEMDFLVQLCSQAAAAFETVMVYKSLDESKHALARQIHKLSIIYEIGRAMNYVEDLTNLLVQILDQAISLVDASKGSLMLLENDELVVRVVRGIDKITEEKIINGEIQCTRIRMGMGIAGIVAETGQPLLIEDTENDERFLVSSKSNVKNIMCVPLIVFDETIGVINISNKKHGKTFIEDDLKIISTLTELAAVAINNARLYKQAVTDNLTKLYVRRYLMQSLDTEVRRSKRYSHVLSLMMLEIDNFKEITEKYGHKNADNMLAEVAAMVTRSIRSIDMAARYSGDKICIMLPETNSKGALFIAERLRKEVEKMTFKAGESQIKATASIGIAIFPDDDTEPVEIIRKADIALYRSKRESPNRCTLYSSPENEEAGNNREKIATN